MQQEFKRIQEALTGAVQLTIFDSNTPAVIKTDASLKGLGTVLLQGERPERFLRKSLTSMEMDYSNIELELLAVLFACEKMHIYVFGRDIIIHTDHKLL